MLISVMRVIDKFLCNYRDSAKSGSDFNLSRLSSNAQHSDN